MSPTLAPAMAYGLWFRPDVAQAILFLASDEAAWITGTTLVGDGGATITHPPIG